MPASEPPLIISAKNPKLKQARALRQRKARAASGLFVVEGIHHVGQAEAAQAEFDSVFYAPDLLASDYARALVARQSERGVPVYALAPEAFASIADKDNPQGILAVVRQPRRALENLSPENFGWGVAVVAPQDPGNVGAILRTLDAVGADGLLLLDSSVDAYHPSAVRASMGALFWLPVVQASFDDFAGWANGHGYHIYGTSARGQAAYTAVGGFRRPAILLLGSEREGLSEAQGRVCETLIRLPMRGRVSSLNLSVAAGVMLYAMLEGLDKA